jgi:hypothetical protein
MKKTLIKILNLVMLLTGVFIAGVRVSQAALGSNALTVNYNETDSNEPEPEPEPEIVL